MHLPDREHLKRLKREADRLAPFLPWYDTVDAEGVLLHYDGSLQGTLALTGPDLRHRTLSAQASASLHAHVALKALLDVRWMFQSHTIRFQPAPDLKPRPWSHQIAQAIFDEGEADRAERPLLESCHYVTVTYKPPPTTMRWLEALFYTPNPEASERHEYWQYLDSFKAQMRHLRGLLEGVMLEVIWPSAREQRKILYAMLNHEWADLTVPADDTHLRFQLDTLPVQSWDPLKRGGVYERCLTIRDFPGDSLALILASLDDLGFPLIVALRYVPEDRYFSDRKLKRMQETHAFHRISTLRGIADRLWGSSTGGEDPMRDVMVDDIKQVRVALGTEESGFGGMTLSVRVWDAEWARSERKLEAVRTTLHGLGYGARDDGVNTLGAVIGTLAGVRELNPIDPKLKSMNVAHLMAVDGVYSGSTWNEQWKCPHFFTARTSHSNAYHFQPEHAGVQHIFFEGPTGSGKSTWWNHLRVMVRQVPRIRDIGLDVKASSKVTTYCLGGRFDDLGREDVKVQPFRDCHRYTELEWGVGFVMRYLADRHAPTDGDIEKSVRETFDRLAAVEPAARTWTGWCEAWTGRRGQMDMTSRAKLHHVDQNDLRRLQQKRDKVFRAMALQRGGVLDGSTPLRIHPIHVFELETLLKTPDKAVLVLRVVDHLIDLELTGDPTLLWYEEVQALLNDIPGRDLPESIGTLNDRIRRARDKNVLLGAGTQNNEDLLEHRLGPVFLNNCPNQVHFPNAEALTEQNIKVYTAMGLTMGEIESLARARYRAEWLHKSPRGRRLAEHRLGPLGVAVCGRSGPEWNEQADEIMARVGPEEFLGAWLKHCGVIWEGNHGRTPVDEAYLPRVVAAGL